MSAQRPVMVMAGGTGGHIFPGLAVARALLDRAVPVVWLGSRDGMESTLVPSHGIPFHPIDARRARGQRLVARLSLPLVLSRAVAQSLRIIRALAPRSVLGLGGFAAGPGGLAAWVLRLPLIIHEQNRVPGMTNQILARVARLVLAGFPDAFPQGGKVRYVGNPVRASIQQLPPPETRWTDRDKPRLLVLGGSQGARRLNEIVPAALARVADPPAVRHQVGRAHVETAQAAYRGAGVVAEVVPFIEDMATAYAQADLVIARSGALTVSELAAAGVGSLLVPFPFAVDDHQTRNAEFLAAAEAAEILPESGLDPEVLAARLEALLPQRERLLRMACNARRLARPDAAGAAADACLEVAR